MSLLCNKSCCAELLALALVSKSVGEETRDGPKAFKSSKSLRGLSMRFLFFGPRRDEVATVASDLIMQFGIHAHSEALHLAELSQQMRARWNRQLYRLAAREIETSFSEAQKRLGLPRLPRQTGDALA